MKKTFLLAIFLVGAFLFAGTLIAPATAYGAACNDGEDNDVPQDFKADFSGTAEYPPDPGCSSATDNDEKDAAGAGTGTGTGTTTGTDGGSTDLGFSIDNPLDSDIDTLPEFINKIVEIFLMVGTPIVALAIIYSGFLFVVARGNPEAIEKAKKTLGFTLLGAAILLGAFVISTAIQDTIMNISSESE